eukprot:SAG11_NODE_29396_length_311_cov_0.825472_1_plen_73_part_01
MRKADAIVVLVSAVLLAHGAMAGEQQQLEQLGQPVEAEQQHEQQQQCGTPAASGQKQPDLLLPCDFRTVSAAM